MSLTGRKCTVSGHEGKERLHDFENTKYVTAATGQENDYFVSYELTETQLPFILTLPGVSNIVPSTL